MTIELEVVTLGEFVNVDEPGADALLGDAGSALVPEGGDVMIYGDGGAGKTTLEVDLACHLSAGEDWLGIPVARPVNVLVAELEGPRPHFRAKLARKRAGWRGGPLSRVQVLESPWATITLADEEHREALAAKVRELEIDVVIIGPVTAAGMLEAGTIAEVRAFMRLVDDVRSRSGRIVTFVLVHHESKSGKVSGAWEGAGGDTLIHVQGQGHGRTRVYFQKARWASSYHATSLQLKWTHGEGFEVEDKPELDDDAIADQILVAALANGGGSWNKLDEKVDGKNDRKRAVRDRLLAGGRLIDTGDKSGMKLWHADDPARPVLQEELSPNGGAPGAQLGVTP